MRAVFPQAKELKNLIAATVAFLSEGTFKATEDGIHLASLDPSNVAIIILDLYQDAFLDYSIEREEMFTISLEDVKKILAKAKAREQIIWELDKERNRFILIIKGKATKKFILPLIESESEPMQTPNLDLPIQIEMDARAFKEIIDSAKVVADEVKFLADPEGPTFSIIAEGELKEMHIDLTPQDETVLTLEIPQKAVARYSVDYLHKLTKVATISDTVVIRFNSNMPVWFDYKLADRFKYSFILAPRE
ncbi:MAG TPA: proliferating cell nuclear antigen (pcna) [Candidatus Nanopusillus sp.]|nr:proliferating cell nuclear antigen (pcna) [Candidatus Nanopusillus sp.]